MKLTDLGLDGWFEQQAAPFLQPGRSLARVTAVDRGAFLVRTRDAGDACGARRKIPFFVAAATDLPCVGDWVSVQEHATGGPVHDSRRRPPKTFLRRKCPGKTVDFQMIAANIDVAFIVQACGFDFNPGRLDWYLVMAGEGGSPRGSSSPRRTWSRPRNSTRPSGRCGTATLSTRPRPQQRNGRRTGGVARPSWLAGKDPLPAGLLGRRENHAGQPVDRTGGV
ncbi:MAG: hypothetical protein U1G05_00705 [Kiritimatiellia bacterium]